MYPSPPAPPAPPPKAHGLALGSSSYFVFLLIASSPPFGQTMLNYLPFPLDKETCPPAALCPLRGVWMGWDSSFFFLHSYLRAILLSSLCCDGINAGYHSTMALMVTHPFFRNLWCSLKGCTPYSHGRRGQLQWDNRMYSLLCTNWYHSIYWTLVMLISIPSPRCPNLLLVR